MAISTSDFKNGMNIVLDDGLFQISEFQHVKPGKGGAFVRTTLRNLRTGAVIERTFRAGEKMERAVIDKRDMQYLYAAGDEMVFMDNETYEQVELNTELLGEDQVPFLQDGMVVIVESHEGVPLGAQLPNSVILEVTEADAVVKGQTASSSFKPAVMENGVRVMVPPHIEAGTRIVVSTADRSYMERAKD